jgi:SAM-dependent methyltransferase
MMQSSEPLESSAPIAWKLAPQLCRTDPLTGESCAWLHGFWQCLRILRFAATPERHRDFYDLALKRVCGDNGPPRMLVSGAADYSMLAEVLAALRSRNVEPAVTVVDVCETPLYLNRWYADRVSCRIQTHRCSILEYSAPAQFDAVCTHSFLGQFSREQRSELLAAWRRLLRPRGHVITVFPLRPSGPDVPRRFTSEQAQALRAAVAEKANDLGKLLQVDPQDIVRQAERYLKARYGYPVRSREESVALFEEADFRVDEISCRTVTPDCRSDIGGPGLRTPNVSYGMIIASRQ